MKNILVIDDLLTENSQLGQELIRIGRDQDIKFKFIKVPSEALKELKTDYIEALDMILLDANFDYRELSMKGYFGKCLMQGSDMVVKIRELSLDIPVIAISADSKANERLVRKGATRGVLKDNLVEVMKVPQSKTRRLLNWRTDRL